MHEKRGNFCIFLLKIAEKEENRPAEGVLNLGVDSLGLADIPGVTQKDLFSGGK